MVSQLRERERARVTYPQGKQSYYSVGSEDVLNLQ